MTVEMLKAYGADVKNGLTRCMNNETFYFRLIGMAVADGAFDALGQALAAGDLDGAFEEAHKLKGVMGNLALIPILEPVKELTELLRHKTPGDYGALYEAILEKKNELASLLG